MSTIDLAALAEKMLTPPRQPSCVFDVEVEVRIPVDVCADTRDEAKQIALDRINKVLKAAHLESVNEEVRVKDVTPGMNNPFEPHFL